MSDAYELLEAGSTVTGDTWTMLNNLGGGTGIGQVVENLEGTVLLSEELIGIVQSNELTGIIESNSLNGIVSDINYVGTIDEETLIGEITCE